MARSSLYLGLRPNTRNPKCRRRVVDTSNTPSCSILGVVRIRTSYGNVALVNPVIDVAVSVISGVYAETTELTAPSSPDVDTGVILK
jgi:hypothetical protein